MLAQALSGGQLAKPARGFIHGLKREAEGPIMHWHEPLGLEIAEGVDGFVRPHVNVPEAVRIIRPNRQHGHFGRAGLADLLESAEISAVPGVINAPTLMLEQKAAVTAVVIAQNPRAPVLGRREGDFPALVGKAFPPLQLNDAPEAQIPGQIAHAPGHNRDFWRIQPAQGGAMEMIEVGVGEEHQINARQVLNLQPGAADALQQKQPVGEIGINQHIEVRELRQKRSVPDPGQGRLPARELGKSGPDIFAGAPRQQSFPHQLVEKGPRIEMLAGREVLEGAGQQLSSPGGFGGAARLIFSDVAARFQILRFKTSGSSVI